MNNNIVNFDNIYYFKHYKTTMNASITLYIIALMALLSATTAFFGGNMRTKAQSRNTLKMASSYIQKLGERVINPDTETETKTTSEVGSLFRRDHIGSGMDERQQTITGEDINDSLDQISRIDKNYRQQSLLMSLEDSSVLGTVDKAQRVKLAASEGLLPSSFGPETHVSAPSMTAGGLMNDWDFDQF